MSLSTGRDQREAIRHSEGMLEQRSAREISINRMPGDLFARLVRHRHQAVRVVASIHSDFTCDAGAVVIGFELGGEFPTRPIHRQNFVRFNMANVSHEIGPLQPTHPSRDDGRDRESSARLKVGITQTSVLNGKWPGYSSESDEWRFLALTAKSSTHEFTKQTGFLPRSSRYTCG
nr:hypothetical protein [Bradyrhizobium sp. Cp5.3]